MSAESIERSYRCLLRTAKYQKARGDRSFVVSRRELRMLEMNRPGGCLETQEGSGLPTFNGMLIMVVPRK